MWLVLRCRNKTLEVKWRMDRREARHEPAVAIERPLQPLQVWFSLLEHCPITKRLWVLLRSEHKPRLHIQSSVWVPTIPGPGTLIGGNQSMFLSLSSSLSKSNEKKMSSGEDQKKN